MSYKYYLLYCACVILLNCKSTETYKPSPKTGNSFTIAFGSCNKHTIDNYLWDDIRKANPNIWIWGGDNIYADTDDVNTIRNMYASQNNISQYRRMREKVAVIGIWDDHDYGLNDGGREWHIKDESQQALLDFLAVPDEDPRRTQKGIYTSYEYQLEQGKVKIILLDTRYFRTALSPDDSGNKRYVPNQWGVGTILGGAQWDWLEEELRNSDADFNILVSSIQFLSGEHGFETWANFPHEVEKLKELIVDSEAQRVIILSGDRHISELSRTELSGLSYPLLDFTSSGLTHAYREYSGEPNPFRVGKVVAIESFGIVELDLSSKLAKLWIIGNKSKIQSEFQQQY